MRVLLTGANGLLGQHLLPLLSADPQIEAFATGLGANRNPPGKYIYSNCDLTEYDQVYKLIAKIKPEYIIHAAAKTQVDWCEKNKAACWKSNVEATGHLLEAAERWTSRFQYISTDFVFDGLKGGYKESDAPNPVNYYGESKLAAEDLVRSYDGEWSIARTVLVYGVAKDLSRSNIITWIWKSLQANQPINVVTDQIRTPTFVEDLALGSYLIMEHKAIGIYHIAGEETMTPYDMAIKLARYFKLNEGMITPVDASTFTQPGQRPKNTDFNITKAKDQLNYKPRTFDEGLKSLRDALQDYSG